jgi:hypothetical protein
MTPLQLQASVFSDASEYEMAQIQYWHEAR